jgi:hypothetical protein
MMKLLARNRAVFSDPPLVDSRLANSQSVRETLMRHAMLRDQLQSAIVDLIRGYEMATGFSVVRLDYHPEQRQFLIDALPQPKPFARLD